MAESTLCRLSEHPAITMMNNDAALAEDAITSNRTQQLDHLAIAD
jgi:hypothetical protein